MKKFFLFNLQFFLLMALCFSQGTVLLENEIPIEAIYNKNLQTISYAGKVFHLERGIDTLKMISEIDLQADKVENNSAKETKYLLNISIIGFLTLFAGAMSGLTVGYLSIDDLVLELKSKTGTDSEQYYANKILPIINKRHWLLVTLLLWNATAMEALPIFLNKLVDEYAAIIMSVSLVLFFGEIIPQALCTGPNQLKIAAFFAPLTNFLMYISFLASYPIAKLLDYLVGKHSKSRFVNTDLKGLIELHTLEAIEKLSREQGDVVSKTNEIGLHHEQADLMISALEIKERKANEIMIPLENIFMIDIDEILEISKIQLILDRGYSRIPIYSKDRNAIHGILRIKQLIGIDIHHNKSIKQLGIPLSAPILVQPETPAMEMLQEFRKGKSHMAFVVSNVENYIKKFGQIENEKVSSIKDKFSILSNNQGRHVTEKILGLVTLEDVLEKMINIEILDEDDYAKTRELHDKKGTNQKSKFYKNAITRELAKSFLEENKYKIGSLFEGSSTYRPGKNLLLANYEEDPQGFKEPLL